MHIEAQEGVYAKDLFRRPGNIAQIKNILQQFASDQVIDWKDYNIHTVGNVAKRVLFNIPNGLIGIKGEKQLLSTALLTQQQLIDTNQVKTVRQSSTIYNELNDTVNIFIESTQCQHTNIDDHQHTSLISSSHNDNQMNRECNQQVNGLLRRAIVLTNIQSNQSLNIINLLFSYGSIKQIYQLTPIDIERVHVFHNILKDLTTAHRQLTIMIFGILHQLVFNMAYNTACQHHESEKDTDDLPNIPLLKLAEGVVKSVAGSLFHSCTSSIVLINQTTQVLQSLVICFPVIDKEFTQFYWDILNNRYKLKKSKLTSFTGVKINCSKPDGIAHSEPYSFMTYSKSACSNRLMNAAGRLFCFTNTTATNSTRQLHKSKQYLPIHDEASMKSSSYPNTNGTNNPIKPIEIIVSQPVDLSTND
ncbi:Unconventional myosin-IXa-like protein, partial [Schistosoma japonicum]